MVPSYSTPGVYREERFPAPAALLRTGVPAFLGYAQQGEINVPRELTLWPQFAETYGEALPQGFLAGAVRGFFENGGERCLVLRLDDQVPAEKALREGLAALEPLKEFDLLCVPEAAAHPSEASVLQGMVLAHCDRLGDRFAILDARPGGTVGEVQVQRRALTGTNGALYYPWIDVGGKTAEGRAAFAPPCGHVAGIYARSDRRTGVHKAPANEMLQGVLDLEIRLADAEQGELNPLGINCLRVFPGRGIRVWGARTLSFDPAWRYVNVRRLFLTAGRWIERNMAEVVFEPNEPGLWARIVRDLGAYFSDLFRRGALKGRTPQEAFYVKCNAETNAREVREAGMLVTEIGLAPALPGEFIVIRIIHGTGGVTILPGETG